LPFLTLNPDYFFRAAAALRGPLAGTRIRASTLATHGQTTAVAEAAIASDIHQTLDIHRGFTTKITFNRELGDLIADLLQITVGQILDLL
jgi:hypothetical protein